MLQGRRPGLSCISCFFPNSPSHRFLFEFVPFHVLVFVAQGFLCWFFIYVSKNLICGSFILLYWSSYWKPDSSALAERVQQGGALNAAQDRTWFSNSSFNKGDYWAKDIHEIPQNRSYFKINI